MQPDPWDTFKGGQETFILIQKPVQARPFHHQHITIFRVNMFEMESIPDLLKPCGIVYPTQQHQRKIAL